MEIAHDFPNRSVVVLLLFYYKFAHFDGQAIFLGFIRHDAGKIKVKNNLTLTSIQVQHVYLHTGVSSHQVVRDLICNTSLSDIVCLFTNIIPHLIVDHLRTDSSENIF